MLTVRMQHKDYVDLSIVADLKGAKVGSLVHQYIREMIRIEKEREPGAFDYRRPEIEKRIAQRSEEKRRATTVAAQKRVEKALREKEAEIERQSQEPKQNNSNATNI